eukprot:39755-Chlamydomonas_euryale.AAC.1
MRAHLAGEAHFGCAGCTGVPDHVKKQFQAINREKNKAEVHKRKMQKLDVMTAAFSSASGSASQSTIKASLKTQQVSTADEALARWAFATGVAFSKMEDPYFQEAIHA